MLRLNRGRVIGILLTTFIFYFLFLSSANTNSDFRRRTEEGLSRRHGVLQGDVSDEVYRAQTKQQLDDILARREGQKPLRASDEGTGPAGSRDNSDGDGPDDKHTNGVAGRKKLQKAPSTKEKPKYPLDQSDEKQQPQQGLKDGDGDGDGDDEEKEASAARLQSLLDPGKTLARQKLQEYFKNPLVIFSKSYCPHSKRAKHLLLEVYKIIPAPYVVELNELTDPVPNADGDDGDGDSSAPRATIGQKLQEILFEISGRRTVPNIMVGTTSIGGNDLLWQMHEEGTLVDKIRELAGKRITSIELVGG